VRRNADEDLRALERVAHETRSAADIARYERAATRAGIRRLVAVGDLMEPTRVARSQGGVFLGHPVQVARVIEVDVLGPRSGTGRPGRHHRQPDPRSGFGAGRNFTFFTESAAPWTGGQVDDDPTDSFDGLWGRAVDPPEVDWWPISDNELRPNWVGGLAQGGTPNHSRIWTIPVSVPGDWRRLVVTHVYAWTKLPEWAAEVPRVLRTASVTGHMTGFLVGDPVADTRRRRNPDEDLRRLARNVLNSKDDAAAWDRLFSAAKRAGLWVKIDIGPSWGAQKHRTMIADHVELVDGSLFVHFEDEMGWTTDWVEVIGFIPIRKQNPDEDLRDLERRVREGDRAARARLQAERRRRGLPGGHLPESSRGLYKSARDLSKHAPDSSPAEGWVNEDARIRVYETSSDFQIEDLDTGESRGMGDGADMFHDRRDRALWPGTREFNEAMANEVERSGGELREAYFG